MWIVLRALIEACCYIAPGRIFYSWLPVDHQRSTMAPFAYKVLDSEKSSSQELFQARFLVKAAD